MNAHNNRAEEESPKVSADRHGNHTSTVATPISAAPALHPCSSSSSSSSCSLQQCQLSTRAIHCGQSPSQWTHRALIPPITVATTYELDPEQLFDETFVGNKYDYSRSGNPSRDCLEEAVATLESARYALCFSSGMAATVSVCHLLRSGEELLCSDDIYGGSHRYFARVLSTQFAIDVKFIDFTQSAEKLSQQLSARTRLIWLETPTNPLMKVVDLRAVDALRRERAPEAVIACDNTFMSPVFQKPLQFGVDIVVHSLTKYINGHADVIMGAVMTNREDLYNRLKFLQNALGCVPSPIDCFLVNRGLKTLTARMCLHEQNGLHVAHFLQSHPMVSEVLHIGLESHPQHELAKRQCTGFSGMISFRLKGQTKQTKLFLKSLKLFKLVVSLGSVESRVELPARMSHASVPSEHLNQMNINDSLLRLSVGIEDKTDLVRDLSQALDCAHTDLLSVCALNNHNENENNLIEKQ